MKTALILLLVSLQTQAYQYSVVPKQVGPVKVPFVRNAEIQLNANQEENFYSYKADYALIEKMAPLNPAALSSMKANDFRSLTMEEFNQIYARLGSGPMPAGDYNAFVMQKPPVYYAVRDRVFRQIKAVKVVNDVMTGLCGGKDPNDCLLELAWKGKRFEPRNEFGQVESKTLVNLVSAGFKSTKPPSWLPGIVGKTLKVIDEKTSITMFPMNTYCGISQLDTRRESIIADASFGDDFPDYIGLRDEVVTRKNLNITEEFRMVRPGLYIGKVYTNKIFLFNVALESNAVEQPKETANACFDGTRTR